MEMLHVKYGNVKINAKMNDKHVFVWLLCLSADCSDEYCLFTVKSDILELSI